MSLRALVAAVDGTPVADGGLPQQLLGERFAFTQGVSRTRWLITRLIVVGTGTAVPAPACSLPFP